MSITILGLGPGDPQLLTLEARQALQHARTIYLRTRQHPTVAALPAHLKVQSFDHLYETIDHFETIYATIADDIVARGEKGDVLYAVPGHPLFGEISVQKILAQARAKKIPTRILPGISFVDAACVAVGLDPLARGLQVADATDLARQHFPQLDPDQPALVGQLYNRAVASDCKLTLLVLYPPAHLVTLVHAAGTAEQRLTTLPLEALDRRKDYGLLMTLYVPPLPRPSSMNALAEVIAHLRAPEGCPWDREQTHRSLREDFLEECYEVLETLDENDIPHLQEELGDLFLHVLLQAQIASEAGEFLLTDVVADIIAKLIRRHPHVFGNVQVSGTEEIIANWDKIKEAENAGKPKRSGIPRDLPALARAQKVARRGKIAPALQDIAAQIERLPRSRQRARAIGEILFALAAYATEKHVDAESALRELANIKTRQVAAT
jgi:tetrapyrrole methylase family protein/MazG family protein